MTLDEKIRRLRWQMALSIIGVICSLVTIALSLLAYFDNSLLGQKWWYWTTLSFIITTLVFGWPRK